MEFNVLALPNNGVQHFGFLTLEFSVLPFQQVVGIVFF